MEAMANGICLKPYRYFKTIHNNYQIIRRTTQHYRVFKEDSVVTILVKCLTCGHICTIKNSNNVWCCKSAETNIVEKGNAPSI